MDCFVEPVNGARIRATRWLATTAENLAPLAGRGPRRSAATYRGEGDYPQVRAYRESPSPARQMLATSPRKRGEVKNGDEPWIASWSLSSGAHSRDPLARD